MKAAIIIPARYESSRFPGKPLALINDRPLIEWTWRAAMQCQLPVFVATDDQRIALVAAHLGARVINTPKDCRNGTERCAAALAVLGGGFDVVVNWQGDAPLIPGRFARGLVDLMLRDLSADVATAAYPGKSHEGCVSVIVGPAGDAVAFIRRDRAGSEVLHHLGIYAYRGDALRRYAARPETPSERADGLEQLRWDSFDQPIRCMIADPPTWPLREVNYPADIAIVADVLRERDAAPRS